MPTQRTHHDHARPPLDTDKLAGAIECLQRIDGRKAFHVIFKEVFLADSKLTQGAQQLRVTNLVHFLHEILQLNKGILCDTAQGKVRSLTPAGQNFVEKHAGAMLEHIEESNRRLHELIDAALADIKGKTFVKMAVCKTMDVRWLAHFETQLQKADATGHICVDPPLVMLSETIIHEVDSGRQSIGVLQFPEDKDRLKQLQDLKMKLLLHDPYVVVMTSNHPLAKTNSGPEIQFNAIRSAKGYCRFTRGQAGESIKKRLIQRGTQLPITTQFNSFLSIESTLRAGSPEPRFTIVPALAITSAHLEPGFSKFPGRFGDRNDIVYRPITGFGPARQMGFIQKRASLTQDEQLVVNALNQESKLRSATKNVHSD